MSFFEIDNLRKPVLQEEDNHHFMLVQQARTSDGVPEEAKQIIGQNTIGDFSDQLMPL